MSEKSRELSPEEKLRTENRLLKAQNKRQEKKEARKYALSMPLNLWELQFAAMT